LKPVSAMSWEIDMENLKDCENPEEYYEEYRVDVDDDELERILEGADGRIEVLDDIATRYMPECFGKSEFPMFLRGEWHDFLKPRYKVTSGTHAVKYEDGRLVAPDMNLFSRHTRRPPSENLRHMMLAGCPAPNWCLEVEFQNEARQTNKGFDKVNNLFSYRGANDTAIDEIWLLIYPNNDPTTVQVPAPPNPLPIVPLSQARPARGSKYFAVFVRNLDAEGEFHYVEDAERPLLVGYYLIEPNMIFQVPACSLLSGAPDILTNELLDAMGYTVQQQQQERNKC
jgi:hypothetical protein